MKHSDGKEFRFSFLHFCKSKAGGRRACGRAPPNEAFLHTPGKRTCFVSALGPVWAAGGYHSSSETSFRSSATKKLQGLDLSSAKKQIGTCEDFRRSYSLQGAMQVCDLDLHSVKGPGVDAIYHVPYAEALVSSCNVNVLSKLVPT